VTAAVSCCSKEVKPADAEEHRTTFAPEDETSSGGLTPAEPGVVARDERGQRGDDIGSTSDGSGLARGARGLPKSLDGSGEELGRGDS